MGYLGHSSIVQGSMGEMVAYGLTLFASTTWLGLPIVLNGPSWFVSTIWFFYWIFPSLLPRLQRLSTEDKQWWIRSCFGIQIAVAVILHFSWALIIPAVPQINTDGLSGIGFYFATFWPPSRLPIFIMGVLAGLLRREGIPIIASQSGRNGKQWALNTDVTANALLIVFIAVTVLHNWPFESVISEPGFWMQLVLPWWMLQLVSSLTFEPEVGKSRTYRILSHKCCLELGRISYALYLIHEPMRQYLCWILYGVVTVPHCDSLDVVHTGCRSQMFGCDWYDLTADDSRIDSMSECDMEWQRYNESQQLPLWSMPCLWIACILLSFVLNRLVEEPIRKWLRPRK